MPLDRAPEQAEETTLKGDAGILCASCQALVTRPQHAAEAAGRHHHRFMNPAGMVFNVRCFSEAEGAGVHGPATDEYSWFPGHVWQFAHCAGCTHHLGWWFSGEGTGFFGFIAEQLLEGGEG